MHNGVWPDLAGSVLPVADGGAHFPNGCFHLAAIWQTHPVNEVAACIDLATRRVEHNGQFPRLRIVCHLFEVTSVVAAQEVLLPGSYLRFVAR
jgi:hypothetical protein